jgi:uncharacterized Ntn-hydrolase superfamily protein
MTFSIVARDEATGEMGVAVATCMFAVGSIAPWARAGVGAVATQSIADPAYGPRCLDLMAAGASAPEALVGVRAGDAGALLRQVGVVDTAGRVSSFTGALCIDHAGHHEGSGYAVQANMMASDRVWPAMADAYEAGSGRLPERLLAALRAGQRAGGDARGQMSAALLIVDREPQPDPWAGVTIDIRVDRAAAPLEELARLLDAAIAYRGYQDAVDALMGGRPDESIELLEAPMQRLPGEGNFVFVLSGALAAAGRTDGAIEEMRRLLAGNPAWAVLARSFAAKGLLRLPEGADLDELMES